jgi:predicted ATP-grasp superfamily ATP-dependent carboligase
VAEDPSIPAVVLGGGITALGTLRSLTRRDVEVYCLSGADRLLRWSRYRHTTEECAYPLYPAEDLYALMERLPFPRAVVFPCGDDLSRALSHLDGSLAERFPSVQPPREAWAQLTDKEGLAGLLSDLGIPHPTTIPLLSTDDLATIPNSLLASGFLKPTDSQAFMREFGRKAFEIPSREEGEARLGKALSRGLGMMFQEYVPGSADAHYFIDGLVDATAAFPARFARRRLRMYPPRFGNSSLMVSVALEQVQPAMDSLEILLREVGYRGIFSTEFKFDSRDNTFKLLEVNTRPWWYIGFPDDCGVPIARMAYEDALERSVAPVDSYRVGVSLVYPYYDFFASLDLWRRKELTLRSWIASWMTARKAVWEWGDPLPAVVCGLKAAWEFLGRRAPGRGRRWAQGSRLDEEGTRSGPPA